MDTTPAAAPDPSDRAATIFFDGGCPLCLREIRHYRRRPGASNMLWIDISQDTDALAAHGLTRDQAMARFHVRDAVGRWHTGAWAFAELWSHLPAYRWLAGLLRGLNLLPALDRAYTGFARWRLRRRCLSDSCERPGL